MLVWLLGGGWVPICLLGCGIYFLFFLRFRPFCRPHAMLSSLSGGGGKGGISPFRGVTLALAGTLGVGNIVGVANAVFVGGAGAVFWMWGSALAAMILKYAEILLAVAHRRQNQAGFFGGAYYYIKDHFEARGKPRLSFAVSSAFAVLMIAVAFSMGGVIQANAVGSAFKGVLHIPTWVVGVALALMTLPIIRKGGNGISALTELLVPIMTLGFLVLSAAVLILRREVLGEALASIFREAFSPQSIGGGLFGFLTSRAVRTGTMRGLLSNEAGCGTAPTAHATSDAKSPAAQGVWGIFEVFVDTVLLCTVTALVILVSFSEVELLGHDPVMMSIRAYSLVLGGWSEWFFCAALFCFGYATLLCWANYGLESLRFLGKGRVWRALYLCGFGVCIAVGATAAPDGVWAIADLCLAVLTTVNLIILLLMRREIKRYTDARFL